MNRAAAALAAALFACTPAPTAGTACSDLRALNAAVRADGLSPDQITCMQRVVTDADAPTARRQALSSLLVFDARRLDDDLATWTERARRHVHVVDPTDVPVLLQLARTAQRRGPSGAADSLPWLEQAQAVVATLPSDDPARARQEHDVLHLLAIAAEMQAPPDAPQAARDRTAEAARRWYASAQALDLKTTGHALAMCTNAGADEAWCTGAAEAP